MHCMIIIIIRLIVIFEYLCIFSFFGYASPGKERDKNGLIKAKRDIKERRYWLKYEYIVQYNLYKYINGGYIYIYIPWIHTIEIHQRERLILADGWVGYRVMARAIRKQYDVYYLERVLWSWIRSHLSE